MAEQTPGPETPKTDAAPVAGAAPAAPAAEPPKPEDKAGEKEPSKANAAADAAKNAAKAGLNAFKKIGTGAAGKFADTLKSILALPLLIFKGDLSTRLLTLGFAASLVLIVIAAARLYQRFMPEKPAKTVASNSMNSFFEGEKQLAIATANMVFLDKFSTQISASTERVQVFEFELFVENDSPETSAIMKGHIEEVREFVAAAIQGQSYDVLVTPEGKDALKKQIIGALNRGLKRWTQKGQVKQVFFTRFVMG